jgi:chromate reductase, NAD(P)H dehydrogenase (quinone)
MKKDEIVPDLRFDDRAQCESIVVKAGVHALGAEAAGIESRLRGPRPSAVVRFTNEVGAADAVLFVTPEHNRSIPAVLKNAIDWGSKPTERNVWKGKPVAITGTSPGAIGTAVGQQHLRQILGALGSLVMGGEAYISFRSDLIGYDQNITNEATRSFLSQYLAAFQCLVCTLLQTEE